MAINYTYKIINVDQNARCMEIVYSANGHETLHIGARLPFEGETVEQIVRMYSPISYWVEKTLPVVIPDVGNGGAINAADEAAQSAQAITQPQPVSQGTQNL